MYVWVLGYVTVVHARMNERTHRHMRACTYTHIYRHTHTYTHAYIGTLVVCPMSLVAQWRDEVIKHSRLSVLMYYGYDRGTCAFTCMCMCMCVCVVCMCVGVRACVVCMCADGWVGVFVCVDGCVCVCVCVMERRENNKLTYVYVYGYVRVGD